MNNKLKIIHDSIIIKQSGLFNEDWFKKKYNLNVKYPIRYYLKNCIKLSLDPSPDFDTIWYLNQNTDVKESGINQTRHSLKLLIIPQAKIISQNKTHLVENEIEVIIFDNLILGKVPETYLNGKITYGK